MLLGPARKVHIQEEYILFRVCACVKVTRLANIKERGGWNQTLRKMMGFENSYLQVRITPLVSESKVRRDPLKVKTNAERLEAISHGATGERGYRGDQSLCWTIQILFY